MKVRRMRFACWISETTETHSEYVNSYCFSPATVIAYYIICTLPVRFLNTDFNFGPKDKEGGRI
jgi:hypothetical protein